MNAQEGLSCDGQIVACISCTPSNYTPSFALEYQGYPQLPHTHYTHLLRKEQTQNFIHLITKLLAK